MTENTERIALVTGGGRGIGLACVTRLLADGYRVGVVEINARAIDAARAELATQAERVSFAAASVSDRAGMTDVVAALTARWGGLDVLVNNAGVNRPGGVTTQSDADWDAVLDVNLKGAFVCSAVAAPALRARRRRDRQHRFDRRGGAERIARLRRLQGRADRPDAATGA